MNKLFNYLLSDNILEYENEIFEIIPELKFEKNFNQKSEWHCYDVWDHTIATINACDKNIEDRLILLLHDIGKPFSYQDDGDVRHFKNHAMVSSLISEDILDRLNIKNKDEILKLIKMHSTKILDDDIAKENIEFYKRLLKIQYCDAKGYEYEHSLIILNELDKTKNKILYKIKRSI